jgi:hypothetical protein
VFRIHIINRIGAWWAIDANKWGTDMKTPTVINGRAFSVLHDSGYTVWQGYPLEIEYTKTDDGRYLISGDPMHVKVVLELEALEVRFDKAWDRIPEDDGDAQDRHFERKWQAIYRAVAPLFAELLKAGKAPANKRARNSAAKRTGRRRQRKASATAKAA